MSTTVSITDADLTVEVCEWLAEAGVGTWRTASPYTAGEVAIVYGALPASPDRAIGVQVYGGADGIRGGVSVRRLQVRYRGARNDPTGADDLAQLAFEALHDEHHRDRIARCRRVSFAPWGADENGRQERTDNFEFILNTVSPEE